MSIGKNKVRMAISIHKETKELMNSLLPLHKEGCTYSNLIESALYSYARIVQKQLDDINGKISENKKKEN